VEENQNIETFLADAATEGETDSSGTFTTAGKEVVEKIGRCLLEDSISWVLLIVQAANLWEAGQVRFSFSGGIRIHMSDVGDQREWLQKFVPRLMSGEVCQEPRVSVMQKAVWSALAQTKGSAVLAASGEDGEEPRAVRLGLSETIWGQARLEANSFLLQIEPADSECLKRLEEKIVKHLERYVSSDRTLVLCGREIKAFLPLSPRRDWENDHKEPGVAIALWAWGDEEGGIPVGRSFAGLDSNGMERKELTFGVFRTCLVDKAEKARSIVAFTHHTRPIPSRAVWLWQGTEVGHHDFDWEPDTLAATLYLEAPEDVVWDISQRQFRWEERLAEQLDEATKDLLPSLESLIDEYNDYSPAVEGSTLGCWTMLLLSSLALGGLAAPLMGGRAALVVGAVVGLLMILSEFRYRHRERFSLGHGLRRFVTVLGDGSDRGYVKDPMQVDGEPWGPTPETPSSENSP
jgi:hypothetical protein